MMVTVLARGSAWDFVTTLNRKSHVDPSTFLAFAKPDAEKMRRTESPAWATPNSMREIEPSTAFVLKQFYQRKQEEAEE